MSDQLLLRFRDLVASTVDEHQKIIAQHGYVYWGWWKKPSERLPEPGLPLLARRTAQGETTVFLVDSGTRRLYRARVSRIVYDPGGGELSCPDREACPAYYRDKSLPAWFELRELIEVPKETLERYVWSPNNASGSGRGVLPTKAVGAPVLDLDFLSLEMTLWFLISVDAQEWKQVSSRVEPFSRLVWPTSGRYVLHISDLHFGKEHGFRNHLAKGVDRRLGEESLMEALLDDLAALQIGGGDIAFVAVTGDLTWSGDPHEFENAARMLSELASQLRLHPSQIVVVPGNHDIEWRDEHGDIDENSELNYSMFCERLYGAAPSDEFARIHRFSTGAGLVTCLALNSCRIERRANAGLGFVGRKQLATVAKELAGDSASNELRIALVHHHLVSVNYVEEVDWETKRVSLMLDAESVLRYMISLGVRLVLHGHQHQPFVAEERRVVPGHVDPISRKERVLDGRVIVIGGGSLGVARKHLNQVGRNAYNLVEIAAPDRRLELRTRVRSSVGPGFVDYSPPLAI
jgi:3',5'-cyclic AMP phosphodiesterase CpdA